MKESWTKLSLLDPPSYYQPIGIGKKGDLFFCNNEGNVDQFDVSTQTVDKIEDINVQSWCQTIYMEIIPSALEVF